MLVLSSYTPNIFSNYANKLNISATVNRSNLAPLRYDTISFGNTDKKLPADQKFIESFKLSEASVNNIHSNAIQAKNYLENQLSNLFEDMISKNVHDDKPVLSINYRVKTPESIAEKALTRRWLNEKEVKSGMTDIVGARIIMNNASRENVDKVIEKLTNAEKNGKLRILEIENYRPEPKIDDKGDIIHSYDYASAKALSKLKCECDKKGRSIPKRDEDLPTGYMAIHLLTELPNGFTGEIQIMGKDVAALKDIEDICYKCKSGKSINPIYEPMKEKLEPLMNDDDVLLQHEYNNYTRKAYIYQRNKEPYNIKANTGYLQIPNYLPKELDFNYLAKLKHQCEK